MSLWYAQSGPRSSDTGKFRSRTAPGLVKSEGGDHRGWHYKFVAHQTGSSVRRTSYSVTISDPNNNRAQYLQGFSSIAQATTAAHEWIDNAANKILQVRGGHIGTIPTIPENQNA